MSGITRHRRRIVVKLGSSSVVGEDGTLSLAKLTRLVTQMVTLQRSGAWQLVLVSSGAIAVGLTELGWRRGSITLPEKQAAASVGQTRLMEHYQRLFGSQAVRVGQLLLTRADIEDRKRFLHIRNTVLTLLRNGIVPIVNENDTVAVEEIRFGDNDTLAALVALVAEADVLVLLTDIDGLYTGDPRVDAEAQRIVEVPVITEQIERLAGGAGSAVGTGGMQTKITAAKIAVQAGTRVVVAAASELDVLLRVAAGEQVGTSFHPRQNPYSLRKSWLVHGPHPEGTVVIDAGAVAALLHQSGSLLLPGVCGVTGDFQEGAIVALTDLNDHVLGKGIVNFAARDLADLLTRRRDGENLHNLPEVVHRDHLVIWREGDAP
ncbi:glutamate 5-kinase [Alicyclobacillus sp. ALC3]|uniref:glutamate 5-kinase n=1 Tax=Alicyclobacillus sp. ALC3 TaxID=2796143 RepID=UPI002379F650|nr:glutamate 5-kinase [Alicyclobacillus sp. ALC3]